MLLGLPDKEYNELVEGLLEACKDSDREFQKRVYAVISLIDTGRRTGNHEAVLELFGAAEK